MLQPGARRGRPRKFDAPSRSVTVTLPVRVIEALAAVDADLSRAIVRLTPLARVSAGAPAELTQFGRHAVIVVNRSPSLAKRTGVELVPLPDGRALISFPQSKTIPELELMLDDALEDEGLLAEERDVFTAVAAILRTARRSRDVVLLQQSIIVLENRRRRAPRRPR